MDKKDSELTTTTPALDDITTFVDVSAPAGTENRKCTYAALFVALRVRLGETDSATVLELVLKAFVFSAALGTAVDGSDYDLIITCVDALNMTTVIAYSVTSRTENGFSITPIADAYITYTAILK